MGAPEFRPIPEPNAGSTRIEKADSLLWILVKLLILKVRCWNIWDWLIRHCQAPCAFSSRWNFRMFEIRSGIADSISAHNLHRPQRAVFEILKFVISSVTWDITSLMSLSIQWCTCHVSAQRWTLICELWNMHVRWGWEKTASFLCTFVQAIIPPFRRA